MTNSRLTEYLSSFDKKDWRSFKKFSDQKISKSTELYHLYEHILKNKNGMNTSSMTIDSINVKIFPAKSRKSVLNLFSDMTDIIKEYLIYSQLKEEKYLSQIFLLRALNKRKLYGHADKILEKAHNEWSKIEYDWWAPLYRQMLLHSHYFSDNPNRTSHSPHKSLEQIIENIDLYQEELKAFYYFDIQNNIKLNLTAYEDIPLEFDFFEEYKF